MILLSWCAGSGKRQCPEVKPFPAYVGSLGHPFLSLSLLAQDEESNGKIGTGKGFRCYGFNASTPAGSGRWQGDDAHRHLGDTRSTSRPFAPCRVQRTRSLNRDPKRQIRCSATNPQKKWHYRIIMDCHLYIFTCIRYIYICIYTIHTLYILVAAIGLGIGLGFKKQA